MVRLVNAAAVADRIKFRFDRYEKEAFEIAKFYAIEAMKVFAELQGAAGPEEKGAFWTNHTMNAVEGFFAKAFQVPGSVGITVANSTWYAEKLENEFGGRFASFPTIMNFIYPRFINDIKDLYGDTT